jgi:curved DNA-binding protein CbpA
MSRGELTRRYRKLAMECHPDRGGESEAFVRLQASYERLLRRTS